MRSIDDIIAENQNANISLFSQKGFTVTEIQVCKACKGKGEVEVSEDKGHSKGIETSLVVCKNCLGSGRIEVHVTILRKPFKPVKNDR